MSEKNEYEREWLNLPKEVFLERYYKDFYSDITYSSFSLLIQNRMHKSLEFRYTEKDKFNVVAEFGANKGEHLEFIKHNWNEIHLSDLSGVELDSDLQSKKIFCSKQNIETLSYKDLTFDRVLNTCLLHHVTDPEKAMLEIRRVLKVGGVADIFISSDPGVFFRLARTIGPALFARKLGLRKVKRLADARDHRNHVLSLLNLTRHVFRNDYVEERSFPINRLSWNFSLWHTFHIKKL